MSTDFGRRAFSYSSRDSCLMLDYMCAL